MNSTWPIHSKMLTVCAFIISVLCYSFSPIFDHAFKMEVAVRECADHHTLPESFLYKSHTIERYFELFILAIGGTV